MDEQALIRRLKADDRQALAELIDRYTHYLTAVAARAMGPCPAREDLEEVVSDAFLALWRARSQLEEDRSPRPWLAVTARNLAYDRLRSSRPTQEIPPQLPDGRPGPEELAQRQALHSQLRRLVEEMEEPDRSLFLGYYYEEEPLYRAASRLGLNLSTAKTRLARGRKRLRQAMTGKGGEFDVEPHA